MPLQDIISGPEKVVLDLKATDRWAAIAELIGVLCDNGNVPWDNREAVTEAVRNREETMSTGVGYGVGIPHAASPHVESVVGVIGISREGVEFDSPDDKPVHLVMLFLVPESSFQDHLDTLAEIARTLTVPERRDALQSADNADDVVRIIHEASEA